jgi:hypothetical protein
MVVIMHRRLFSILVVSLAIQAGVQLYDVAAGETIFYVGLFWLVLSMCMTAFTYRSRDIDVRSITLTHSQLGGIAVVMLVFGWMAYPIARWLDGEFGVLTGAWMIASLLFLWGGIRMVRDHERARLLEPGESARDRIESIGWSTHPLAVLKDEAMRSIGVFGLLFIPTMMIVAVHPSLSPSDPLVYLPAIVLTLLHAAVFAYIRITTDAGPHYAHVIEAVRQL